MSMIFDEFVTMDDAKAFVAHVKDRYGLDGQTFDSVEAAMEHDPFPFVLTPPIAHIDRTDSATEQTLWGAVTTFGGKFAGT